MSDQDATQIVQRYWPYDGPHTDESVVGAAQAVSHLVRYVANATYRPVSSGPAFYEVLWRLDEAMARVDQVLRQLAEVTGAALADDVSLRDDRGGSGQPAVAEVVVLLQDAQQRLLSARGPLNRAAQVSSHLGHSQRGA